MAKAKIRTTIHQITPYQAHKGADWLHIDRQQGIHYNAARDRQIKVPIGDINKLRRRLKGKNRNV